MFLPYVNSLYFSACSAAYLLCQRYHFMNLLLVYYKFFESEFDSAWIVLQIGSWKVWLECSLIFLSSVFLETMKPALGGIRYCVFHSVSLSRLVFDTFACK